MLYCENCASYSPDGSKFCIHCGNRFEEIKVESNDYDSNSLSDLVNELEAEGYTIINNESIPMTEKCSNKNVSANLEKINHHEAKDIKEISKSQAIIQDAKNHVGMTRQNNKFKKEKLSSEEKKAKKKEQKENKKASKDVLITTKELLDFIDIDDKDRIVTKTCIINLFQIQTKDIYSFSPTDRNIHIFNFVHFIRGLEDDFKIITMKFPVSTKLQQEYVRKKISTSSNDIYKNFLYEKLDELEYLEEHRFNKEFYLMTFYKLDDDVDQKEKKLSSLTNIGVNLQKMNVEKKIRILHKLNNMNSKLF